MDGWKTIGSFWVPAYFQGRFSVSFRESKSFQLLVPGPKFCLDILRIFLYAQDFPDVGPISFE